METLDSYHENMNIYCDVNCIWQPHSLNIFNASEKTALDFDNGADVTIDIFDMLACMFGIECDDEYHDTSPRNQSYIIGKLTKSTTCITPYASHDHALCHSNNAIFLRNINIEQFQRILISKYQDISDKNPSDYNINGVVSFAAFATASKYKPVLYTCGITFCISVVLTDIEILFNDDNVAMVTKFLSNVKIPIISLVIHTLFMKQVKNTLSNSAEGLGYVFLEMSSLAVSALFAAYATNSYLWIEGIVLKDGILEKESDAPTLAVKVVAKNLMHKGASKIFSYIPTPEYIKTIGSDFLSWVAGKASVEYYTKSLISIDRLALFQSLVVGGALQLAKVQISKLSLMPRHEAPLIIYSCITSAFMNDLFSITLYCVQDITTNIIKPNVIIASASVRNLHFVFKSMIFKDLSI